MIIDKFISEYHSEFKQFTIRSEEFIDEDTKEVVTIDYADQDLIELERENIIKKYQPLIKDNYILYRSQPERDWVAYKTIELFDTGKILCHRLNKNFRLGYKSKLGLIRFNSHYNFKCVSKDEIKKLFNWHDAKNFEYKEKYLYILRSELGKIKIGQAINVEQRVKAITQAAGIKIEILNKVRDSAKYEKVLHKKYKDKKYIGEWFSLDKEDIEYLKTLNKDNIILTNVKK